MCLALLHHLLLHASPPALNEHCLSKPKTTQHKFVVFCWLGLCVLVAASATIEEAVGVSGIVAGPLLGALRGIRAVLQARHDAVHVGSIASTDILHCDLDAAVVALDPVRVEV